MIPLGDYQPDITQVHASLFAIGDCFGVPGAEDWAKNAPDNLAAILTDLATTDNYRAMTLRRAARAAAYLLDRDRPQPRDGGQQDLSEELLVKLNYHPDELTARLSRWALNFRFAPDGSVHRLIDTAAYGHIDNGPTGDEWAAGADPSTLRAAPEPRRGGDRLPRPGSVAADCAYAGSAHLITCGRAWSESCAVLWGCSGHSGWSGQLEDEVLQCGGADPVLSRAQPALHRASALGGPRAGSAVSALLRRAPSTALRN
jgi:hypothetical protein